MSEAQNRASAPVLPIPTPQKPALHMLAAQTPEPFAGPLIPIEIPPNLKSKIQSEARVDVVVAINAAGDVTAARVASTKGESAPLLVTEALRAARHSRFSPARKGEKSIQSQMVLTFLFKPESNEF